MGAYYDSSDKVKWNTVFQSILFINAHVGEQVYPTDLGSVI